VSHRGEELFLSEVKLSGSSGIKADRQLRRESARSGEERGKLFFDGGDGGGRACAFHDYLFAFRLKDCPEESGIGDFLWGATRKTSSESALEA